MYPVLARTHMLPQPPAFWLSAAQATRFEALTTSGIASILHSVQHPDHDQSCSRGVFLAAAMCFAGLPAALAVIHLREDSSAEMLSLAVVDPLRRLGLARQLIGWIVSQGRLLGWRDFSLSYPLEHPSSSAMERLTDAQQGWQHRPGLRLVQIGRDGAQTLIDRLKAVVERQRARSSAAVIPWGHLSAAEQANLGRELQAPEWAWPDQGDAGPLVGQIDDAISLLLLARGEPAGWLITHRINADLIRVSQWWVRPSLQGQGIALLLAEEALRLGMAAQPCLQEATFGIHHHNHSMLALSRRLIEPAACRVRTCRHCLLSL